MFGIGLPELIVIFVVALIVVGPEKLPEIAKSAAGMLNELKKTANDLKDSFQEHNDTPDPGKKFIPADRLSDNAAPVPPSPEEEPGDAGHDKQS